MTKEELTGHIKSVVLPLVTDACKDGGEVANAIKAAVERATSTTATPEWVSKLLDGTRTPDPQIKTREKGLGFARYAWAYGHCVVNRTAPNNENIASVLKSIGDGDLADYISVASAQRKTVMEAIQKAINEGVIDAKAMSATNATAGGFLVPTQFSTDVIEFLRARTVIRTVNGGPRTLPMPMGTLKLPKVTGGTQAAYVGEVQNITKTEAQTGQVTLTFKKLAAVVPFSNDLLRYSSPQADAVIRDDTVRAIQVKEDATFIRSNGSAGAPVGLRYQAPASNVIAANASVSLANTVSDLGKLISQLLNNNVPMTRPAWYMAPRTYIYLTTVQNSNGFYVFRDEMLNNGTLWGWPYGYTTSIPINLTDQGGTTETEVYLVDLDDAVIGEAANLIIDVSADAAYYDGTNVISAFSQDTTVLRAIEEHDFAMRRQESVALLNGVTWQ